MFCCSVLFALVSSSLFPNYRVRFVDRLPDDFDPHSESIIKLPTLTSKDNWTCYIQENQTFLTEKSPEDYLKPLLLGACFEMTHTEYWYFRFCPFRQLTQFRYDSDGKTRLDTFVLGKEVAPVKYEISDNGVVVDWKDGEICEVTKKPRTAHIEFVCDLSEDSSGWLASVSEPSMCSYSVRFNTQYACAFPNVTKDNLAVITCVK